MMERNKINPYELGLLEKIARSDAAHKSRLNKVLRKYPFKFLEKEAGYRYPIIEDKYPEVSMKPL